MSKRDHQRHSRRKVFIAAGLMFSLLVASLALAFWSTSQKRRKPGDNVAATSLSPAGPSKEYIYAGGRLVATEEPGAPASSNNAAFVSQSVPGAMTAGQSYSVSVTMSNNGTTTWAQGSYYLGSQNPAGNTTWGLSQVSLPSASVAPGNQATFTFNVTAPATGGTYNFQWQMLQSGVGSFGALSTNVAVNVTGGGTNNASFVTQSVSSSMTAGQSYSVSVTMSNSGTTTWTQGSYTLGSQNPAGNTTWGLSSVGLVASTVTPGNQATFTFNVTAPATPGNYNFQWQMQQSGVGYFGAMSTNVVVSVTAADRSLSLNGTTAYASAPNSTSLNITGPVTVEAWIRIPVAATTLQGIVERFGNTAGTGGYALRLLGSGKIKFYSLTDGINYDTINSTTVIAANTWYHIAGVYDGSNLKLYVNGVLETTKASTFAPGPGSTPLNIGQFATSDGGFFKGLIDEARVTAGVVYTGNFTPSHHLTTVTGTRGLWKFDGQTGNDASGNGNNAALSGGATYSTTVP